jgi:DNA-binding transcriptional LysR family regulator
MLDTHQLNVFLAAAETLNFTQAAQRLHMTQPSVSQHIQALEQYFSTPLFYRIGRYIELTDAGQALLPLARELVNRSVLIEETMKSLEGEVHGHLLVGCSTTPGKYVLPSLLANFHRRYPKVRVSCHVASQNQALQMVCEGDVHFALASAPYIACKDVEFYKFMTDEVVLLAPLDHPWAAREEIEPEELHQADFIFREETSGTQTAVRAALAGLNVDVNHLETILILGNAEAIALAVQEGLGLGFVSSIVYTRLVKGSVAPIKVKGLNISRDIYLGCHTRRPPTVAQSAFWDLIVNGGYQFLSAPPEERANTVL